MIDEGGVRYMEEKKQIYKCPMHPEVVSDEPGSCPKCGMDLISEEEESKEE